MAASMLLTGCGGANKETSAPESKPENKEEAKADNKEEVKNEDDKYQIKDLVFAKPSSWELETFNIIYSNSQKEHDFLCNVWEGLLESDPHGKLAPALATEWGTKDGGLNWTFKLREGVKWYSMDLEEKADCTAKDFATGLEWVLNFHKNSSSNTSMPIEMIKGAKEYYEYTKAMSPEEALALDASEGSKFREVVGIETPDDYTVVYHCTDPKPYFDSVATSVCLFPMAQGLVDELGGAAQVKGMTNETMWYNGAYTITDYVQNNEKVLRKNPNYWDKDCFLFDTVTLKMVESTDTVYQMYQNGEVDEVDLTESNLNTIYNNKEDKYYPYLTEKMPTMYSWQVHFNFDKMKEDGTPDEDWNKAVANEAFRKSMYYGLDLIPYYKRQNAINPMSCENNAYTMKGLCYTSDGTDYTDLVRNELGLPKNNGEKQVRLDADKAAELKKQAMEELSAQGVQFPIVADFYIKGSNQVALDTANVLKQMFSDSMGDDFIQIDIKTYIQSASQEVYKAKKHSIIINGWGADYGDPQNYMIQEVMNNDDAYYAQEYSNINDVPETENTKQLLADYRQFTEMVAEASKINDNLDERYKAFAKAEAHMINHALCFPCYYDVRWSLTHINPYSRMNSMFGAVNGKMKNWETKAGESYTTEEMDAIKAAYEAE